MTTHIRVVDGVRFACPYCGGAVDAGTLSDGQHGVIHKLPLCETFNRLECRLKMAPESLS